MKKINLPLEKKTKDFLKVLISSDFFNKENQIKYSSLELIKEFIRKKPKSEDLNFIVNELILPQRAKIQQEPFCEIFIYIKNFLVSNINDINELIKNFSQIISHIDDEDKEIKNSICEDFWKSINLKYPPEICLGLSLMFNENSLEQNEKFEEIEMAVARVTGLGYF